MLLGEQIYQKTFINMYRLLPYWEHQGLLHFVQVVELFQCVFDIQHQVMVYSYSGYIQSVKTILIYITMTNQVHNCSLNRNFSVKATANTIGEKRIISAII